MSLVKLEANRQNASLSTGPTSPQGKAASSRNATTHGLTARHSILIGEDPEDYCAFVNAHLDHYRPANGIDRTLVMELADLQWRLRRVPVVETQAWNHEMQELSEMQENAKYGPREIMAKAFVRLVQNKVITNLYSQESRLQGRINRIQKHLSTVQHMRTQVLDRISASADAAKPAEKREEPVLQQKQPPQPDELEICKNEPIRATPKPGRNEPCPCGSGLKYKRCCLNKPQSTEKVLAAAA